MGTKRTPKNSKAVAPPETPPTRAAAPQPVHDVRGTYTAIFAESAPIVRALARGEVPIRERCPKCGHEAEPYDLQLALVEPKDRLRAIQIAGTFGPGAKQQLSDDVVRDWIDRILTVAETLIPPRDWSHFCQQVRAIVAPDA